METPWQKHPDIPAHSIDWRMGEGEGYYDRFYRWFSGLSLTEQSTFAEANKPPRDWENLYQTIKKHPWR